MPHAAQVHLQHALHLPCANINRVESTDERFMHAAALPGPKRASAIRKHTSNFTTTRSTCDGRPQACGQRCGLCCQRIIAWRSTLCRLLCAGLGQGARRAGGQCAPQAAGLLLHHPLHRGAHLPGNLGHIQRGDCRAGEGGRGRGRGRWMGMQGQAGTYAQQPFRSIPRGSPIAVAHHACSPPEEERRAAIMPPNWPSSCCCSAGPTPN